MLGVKGFFKNSLKNRRFFCIFFSIRAHRYVHLLTEVYKIPFSLRATKFQAHPIPLAATHAKNAFFLTKPRAEQILRKGFTYQKSNPAQRLRTARGSKYIIPFDDGDLDAENAPFRLPACIHGAGECSAFPRLYLPRLQILALWSLYPKRFAPQNPENSLEGCIHRANAQLFLGCIFRACKFNKIQTPRRDFALRGVQNTLYRLTPQI